MSTADTLGANSPVASKSISLPTHNVPPSNYKPANGAALAQCL